MTAAVATDRPYQLLPPLDDEQLRLLRQSIEASGVLEPVVFDEDGEILDGHHRVQIAEELGIEYPRRVIDGLNEADKQKYALTVNLARRQLTSATRSAHIMRLRQLGMSIRKIAEATGLPKSTVADSLAQVSGSGHLPEKVKGADGKSYATSRPTPPIAQKSAPDPELPVAPQPDLQTPESADAGTAPPADSGTTTDEPETRPAAPDPEPSTKPAANSDRESDEEIRKRAERQRDARDLLRRIVDLAWSPRHPRGHVEAWAKLLGPYDEELSELCDHARRAIAVLDELIEGAGQ